MGHHQCVSLLLKLKVLANPMDLEGGTPLDYAQKSGHKGTYSESKLFWGYIYLQNIGNRKYFVFSFTAKLTLILKDSWTYTRQTRPIQDR